MASGSKLTPTKALKSLPTPNQLAAAQREYAARNRKQKIDKDTGIPDPFPPPTKKNEVFNKKDYANIDKKASEVRREISCGPMKDLVLYLATGSPNDIGKVRSFFVWIASQRDNKYKVIYDAELDNPFNKAMMAKAKAYDYNKLLAEMCRCAGIPCQVVDGAAKGYQNENATEFPLGTHHWCVVYVDGAWRFIDQNFGCSFVSQGITYWQVVNSDKQYLRRKSEQSDAEKVYYIGEEHFLTDPELFIYKHYPSDDDMQLLARPVTHKQFNEMAVVSSFYFDWDFEDLSEPRSTIVVDNGLGEIWFQHKAEQNVPMHFALLKRSDGEEAKPENALKELVRLENKDGKKYFKIYFKQIGHYKFQVLVPEKESKGSTETWHALVQYNIRCTCPYFLDIQNPVLSPGVIEIGPGALWQKMGIKCDLSGGIIKTVEGFAKLQIHAPVNICFNFHLKANDNDEEEREECVLIESNHETTIVYIKAPYEGILLLKAFTGQSDEPSLQHSCNFLVEADMRCITGFFPMVLQKSVGAVNGSTIMKPMTERAYLHLIDKEDDLEIKLTMLTDVIFLVKLLFFNGFHEVHMNDDVWCQKIDNILHIACRFKFAGEYTLRIYSKIDAQSNSYSPTWKYLLRVEKPTANYLPYAEMLTDWQPHMILASPHQRFLKQVTDYEFEVHVPDLRNVGVVKIGEGENHELEKEEDNHCNGKYRGTINSLHQEGVMILFSEMEEDTDVRQLLRYQVINEQHFAKMVEEHETNVAEALTKLELLEQERRSELKSAKERKNVETRRADMRRKEYEEKKEQLFAEEKRLEEKMAERQFKTTLYNLYITAAGLEDLLASLHEDVHVHKVLVAALLLLGCPEDKSNKLEKCKKVIKTNGYQSIEDQMMHIKLGKIDSAIMVRARQIWRQVDFLALKRYNPDATPIFEFVKECSLAYKGDLSVKSADTAQQKEILKRK